MKGKSPIQFLFLIGLAVIAAILTGCSTQKNTAQSRWWHAFNARYNTYYNGTVAYIDGALEKEEGNRDNFTEQIPLYTVGNRNSRDLGKANFDRAIENPARKRRRKISNGSVAGNTIRFYGKRGC